MVVVASINGSPHPQSRTQHLLTELCAALGENISVEASQIDLCAAARDIFNGPQRANVTPKGEAILRQAETADILIVGTPVYRASYTGLLKQFFDLLSDRAMAGRIAIPVASGETAMHGLMLEHQMRPLLGSLGMRTTSQTLFGTQHEISDAGVLSRRLRDDARRIAFEAVQMFLLRACMALESFSVAGCWQGARSGLEFDEIRGGSRTIRS